VYVRVLPQAEEQCPIRLFWTEIYVVDLARQSLSPANISSGFCSGAQRDVRVYCNVLISFLKDSRSGTLYGFGNIVGGVPIGSAGEYLSIIKSGDQQLYDGATRGGGK
jgi:hypothetical protein